MVLQRFETQSTRLFLFSLAPFPKAEACSASAVPGCSSEPSPLREGHPPREPGRCTASRVSPGPQDWHTGIAWGFWMCKETLPVSRASPCFDAEEVGNGGACHRRCAVRTVGSVPLWYCGAAFLRLQDIFTCQMQEKPLFRVILHALPQITLLVPGQMYNPIPEMTLLFHTV